MNILYTHYIACVGPLFYVTDVTGYFLLSWRTRKTWRTMTVPVGSDVCELKANIISTSLNMIRKSVMSPAECWTNQRWVRIVARRALHCTALPADTPNSSVWSSIMSVCNKGYCFVCLFVDVAVSGLVQSNYCPVDRHSLSSREIDELSQHLLWNCNTSVFRAGGYSRQEVVKDIIKKLW